MKIDTSTGWLGVAAEACAMPASKWRGESIEAPYTEIAVPTERSRKLRRSIPVPAGNGIPGSIEGSPRPAAATPRRSSWARLKSLQEHPPGISAHLAWLGDGVIAVHQLTCMSGEVAISIRRAFWRSARKGLCSHSAVSLPSRQDSANAAMHCCDSAESGGSAQ